MFCSSKSIFFTTLLQVKYPESFGKQAVSKKERQPLSIVLDLKIQHQHCKKFPPFKVTK